MIPLVESVEWQCGDVLAGGIQCKCGNTFLQIECLNVCSGFLLLEIEENLRVGVAMGFGCTT